MFWCIAYIIATLLILLTSMAELWNWRGPSVQSVQSVQSVRDRMGATNNMNIMGSNEPAPRTFCAVSSFVGADYIRDRLHGWQEVTPEAAAQTPADFFYYDGTSRMANRYYSVRADIRYWIDCKIWDKAWLHMQLSKLAPDTICETVIPDDPTEYTLPPGPWMIRSNLGTVGSKSRAVDNQADYLRAVSDFTNNGRTNNKTRPDIIMASRYIDDPMLVDNRKFHMRCYIILQVIGRGPAATRKAWLIRQGLMIPALAEYTPGDWANGAIHDSHGHNNPTIKYFPDEWTGTADYPIAELTTRCADVLGRALAVMLPEAVNFPEAGRIGYEMMGADIMFTAAGDAKVIEINGAPAIGDNSPESKHAIFDAILAATGVGDPVTVARLDELVIQVV